MEILDAFYLWFMNIGENYGVNPIIFGSIYVGAIPFFTLSVAWIIHNHRNGLSIILPVFFASVFFLSSYLYLLFAGENVPLWVYAVLIVMVLLGVWSTYKKIKAQVNSNSLPVWVLNIVFDGILDRSHMYSLTQLPLFFWVPFYTIPPMLSALIWNKTKNVKIK